MPSSRRHRSVSRRLRRPSSSESINHPSSYRVTNQSRASSAPAVLRLCRTGAFPRPMARTPRKATNHSSLLLWRSRLSLSALPPPPAVLAPTRSASYCPSSVVVRAAAESPQYRSCRLGHPSVVPFMKWAMETLRRATRPALEWLRLSLPVYPASLARATSRAVAARRPSRLRTRASCLVIYNPSLILHHDDLEIIASLESCLFCNWCFFFLVSFSCLKFFLNYLFGYKNKRLGVIFILRHNSTNC